MKNIKILIGVLLLAILLVGAYVLYNKLAPTLQMSQLATTPAVTASAQEGEEATEPEKNPAPDFTLHDIDGNTTKLSDYQGKPVILNFWASWCGPCKMEMPDFQRMYEQYGEEINFLLVNMTDGIRETVDKASKHVADEGYTFPVFYDVEQEAAYTYGVTAMPTTYFIDAEGNFVAYGQGALDADTLQKGIDMLLSGESAEN